ncbi:polysaccharide deacetylase family protein [Pedobacter sp. KR3-3]|uniref:Polysaccharide deacetylase family protein n=1 Tax=Pedobacter albus TaxID=3113905 RepID=A0ABU7I856_9SPHI|nr:polysaccharide deacetylase family protein [Pedobacter sp. KR3-3]MEE1945658.1 polysaccharide deacetylase family protein [Pedobacter sp. KR3-3]
MYLVKSPLLLKWYYPSLTWNKSRSEKTVYLTFDDGPIPNVTDFVLNTLKSYGIKATFFCIGDNIVKHPTIFERLKNEGHAIGNHTFNHLKGWKTDDETYIDNLLQCQQLTQTLLFRPPYGRIKKSQIGKIQALVGSSRFPVSSSQFSTHELPTTNRELQIVMWDVLSGDFDIMLSPEKCYQNVIRNTKNGAIIVFHDSLKAFDRLQYALPKTIQYLSDKGYQFGTL